MSINKNDDVTKVLNRARILLDAASRFISENDLEEYTVRYDKAECDGGCLQQECWDMSSDIQEVLLNFSKIQ